MVRAIIIIYIDNRPTDPADTEKGAIGGLLRDMAHWQLGPVERARESLAGGTASETGAPFLLAPQTTARPDSQFHPVVVCGVSC